MLTEAAALTPATSAQVQGVLDILVAVAKAILSCIGAVVEVVMANPLLLIPIGVTTLYTIINVFRRLF